MSDDAPWGVYVHVPWCRVQCPYCAFEVQVGQGPPEADPWLAALGTEWRARRPDFPADAAPSTLYLGGGTPSRLPPDAIARIVEMVGAHGEITAEANPEDLDEHWLSEVRAAGVARLSVGVQSFAEATRRRLGRAWVATDPEPALRRVTEAGFDSWSLDLIFAVPGQTLDDLDRDLDAVERLSPPHVALYGLTIEPGTPFERAVRSGRMATVDEAHWRRMYDHLVDRLSALGLQRYEVSNFARPGHHSRHNRLYWSDRPYMGLGPSAHGYLPDGRRYVNAPRLPSWLPDPVGTAQEERPTPEQRLADLLVSGLRAAEGVDLEHARRQTGLRLDPGRIERLVPGLVELHDGRVRLTDAGVPLCDAVVARLLEHAVTK